MELTVDWTPLREACREQLALDITDDQQGRFEQLYLLLIEANRVMNLTRITDFQEFWTRHLLDSLTLLPVLKRCDSVTSLADLGSGAGFPALPIAIVRPDIQVTAIESIQKKAQFIKSTAEALGLTNVRVVSERGETLGQQSEYREQFDIVTARAVAALNVLCELCLPLVKVGGVFLAMKTASSLKEELSQAQNAISVLGGRHQECYDVTSSLLPNRVIVGVDKIKSTPRQYPRSPGAPGKKPIG